MKPEAWAEELRRRANKKKEALHRQLSQPLTFIQKAIVDGASTLYFDVFRQRPKIDQESAALAREKFGRYFPATVEEMLVELLNDPNAYAQKVEEYEKTCPPVPVEFPTNPAHYRLITRDPSRQIQEVLTQLALLSNFPSQDGKYYALDIGTGYGRLARKIEGTLKGLFNGKRDFKVFGMDISESNIEDAKKLNEETVSEIVFFVRDMNKVPFPSNTFNLVNTTDASYLNFRHRRPFYIAEIARVLVPEDGRGCITNPNEKTTLKEYNYLMMRSNYKTYMNPLNIMRSTVLGRCSIHIDGLVRGRPDWEITGTRDMANTLKRALKAEIVDTCDWPEKGGPAIYSEFTFAVNNKTKKALLKYMDFREGQRESENWFNIERGQ